MDKVTIKGLKFKLSGTAITIGSKLLFKAEDVTGADFSIADLKGVKIISFFPAIDTRICDLQTKKIAEYAKRHPHINFVSITMDEIDTIKNWCVKNDINNLTILSDRKAKEFAHATNLYIAKLHHLSRGLILLDANNVVSDLTLNEEISAMPDFTKLESWIAQP